MKWMIIVLLAVAAPAWAGMQKCKDASGKTYFTDRGCVGEGEKVKGDPAAGTHAIGTQSGDDETAQKCLEYVRGRNGLGTTDTTRVENYRVKTVAVKDVGPRRLFNVTVGLRNPAGYWGESRNFDCLLRGDNVTFQTTPYELSK
jgi:hypothetical protein